MSDFIEKDLSEAANVRKVMKELLADVDKIAEKEKEKKISWIIGIISHLISLISMGAISRIEAFSKIALILKIIAVFKLDNVPIIRDMLYSLKGAFDRKFGVKFDLFRMMDGLFIGSANIGHFLFDDVSIENLMKNEHVKNLFYDSFLWNSRVTTADDGKRVINEGLGEISEFLEKERDYNKEKDLEEYYMRPRNTSYMPGGQLERYKNVDKIENHTEIEPNINFTI